MKKILSIAGMSVWLAACAGGQKTEALPVLKLCDVHEGRPGNIITCMAVVEADPSVSNIPDDTGSGRQQGHPGCTQNSDCTSGQACVEGQCQVVADTGTGAQDGQEQIPPSGETGREGSGEGTEDQTGEQTGQTTPPAQPPAQTPTETSALSVRFMTRESDPQVSFPSEVMDRANKVGLTRLHVKIENPGDLVELYFWGDFRGNQCRDFLVRPDGNPFEPGSRGNEDYSYEENASYLNDGVACDPQAGNCVAGTFDPLLLRFVPSSGSGTPAMRAYPDNMGALFRAFIPPTISCRINLMPLVTSGETDKSFYFLIPKDTIYTVVAKKSDGTIKTDVLSLTAPKPTIDEPSVTIENLKIRVSFGYSNVVAEPRMSGCNNAESFEEVPGHRILNCDLKTGEQDLAITVPGLNGTAREAYKISVGLPHVINFSEGGFTKDSSCESSTEGDCSGDLNINLDAKNVYAIKNLRTGNIDSGTIPFRGNVEVYYEKTETLTEDGTSWKKLNHPALKLINLDQKKIVVRRDYQHQRWKVRLHDVSGEFWSAQPVAKPFTSVFEVTPISPACHSVRQDNHTIFSGQRYFFTITAQHIQRIEWSCNAYRINWSRLSQSDQVQQSDNNLDSRYARNGRITEDLYDVLDLNQGVVYLNEGNYESRVFTLVADSVSRRGNCGLIGFDYQDRPQTLDVYTPSACPGLDGIFLMPLTVRDGRVQVHQ